MAVLALPASASAITPPPRITEFAPLTLANQPGDITAGPDGALWFTQEGLTPGIGRMTTSGVSAEYAAGLTPGFSLLMTPKGITEGPDGALWFTEQGVTADGIARMDPATGNVVEYLLPAGTDPTAITTGSDDNLWFIERGASKIGRMTPDGQHDEFNAGLSGSDTLNDITAGPDGQLWVTIEGDDNRIESFSPANPDDPCFWVNGLTGTPNQIVAASDGKLYFTESDNPAAIGRIKTDGKITEYRTGLTADSRPAGIAQGGDKALWFTAGASPGRLGSFSTNKHEFTEFTAGLGIIGIDLTPDATPAGITRGPDGNVWFTESTYPGKIGRITTGPIAELALEQVAIPGRHTITDGVLKAIITANSQDTTYHVEYGPDENYGAETEELSAGDDADPITEPVELPLEPSSHNHARVVATNDSGEAASADLPLWTNADGRISDFDPAPDVEPTVTPTPTPEKPAANGSAGSSGNPPADASAPVADASVAPPVLGKAVVVRPLSGSVRVKAPGARTYSALATGANLPVGTLVDTRGGKIVLQSARNARGRTQNGTFWGGVFQIRQGRKSKGMTDLHLRGGGFGRCGTRAGVSVFAHEAGGKRRVVRRLWGKDKHSRFRTHGRDSVATVRGTKWVTTDRCDGTLTKVTEGKVLVRDLHRKRKVMVRAGHAYLARHHR